MKGDESSFELNRSWTTSEADEIHDSRHSPPLSMNLTSGPTRQMEKELSSPTWPKSADAQLPRCKQKLN